MFVVSNISSFSSSLLAKNLPGLLIKDIALIPKEAIVLFMSNIRSDRLYEKPCLRGNLYVLLTGFFSNILIVVTCLSLILAKPISLNCLSISVIVSYASYTSYASYSSNIPILVEYSSNLLNTELVRFADEYESYGSYGSIGSIGLKSILDVELDC